MFGDWERSKVFPALRVKSDGPTSAEFFNAKVLGVTYKDLPVCTVADGKSISTEIDAEKIEGALGGPTHYYLGSTDECWLLNPDELAWYEAQSGRAGSTGENGRLPQESAWPVPAAQSTHRGGGMLTQHIELS